MPHPGEVFYLPPDPREPASKGARPHVLLSMSNAERELSTLAHGSTSGRDAAYGARHVLIDPRATPFRRMGLSQSTYVYTSRLVSTTPSELGSSAGRIISEMPEIRMSLARALGLGTGVTSEGNVPGSNRRGRLIETTPEVVEDWDVRHALVLTDPDYSRRGYQQTVVPLLDEGFELGDFDVQASDNGWLKTLKWRYGAGILAVPMVSTLYLPDHIARYLDIVVPTEIMADVERALVAHFGLEGYA
jgi:hypothetical protein